MELYPAIDILGGRVVRLERGDYEKSITYGESPVDAAARFKAQGAARLHIVDLDGARDGETTNFEAIAKAANEAGLFTQVGGGIRDMERIARYLDCGVSRVILGTAAVRDPNLLDAALGKFGAAVAVGVDAKSTRVAVGGWLEDSGLDSFEFCASLAALGVKTIIYTDISKDGMLAGPNHDAYIKLSALKGVDIIASGGVSSIDDIKRLAATGIHGAIIGKALYSGRLELCDAISATK